MLRRIVKVERAVNIQRSFTKNLSPLPNDEMNIVIFHNQHCETSRNVVSFVRGAGYDPTIIEYLEAGWTKPQLLGLFAAARLSPRKVS